ncbi:MAG: hypothetical protein ACJ72S_03330 [Nitrososphaeraceae archaeon]
MPEMKSEKEENVLYEWLDFDQSSITTAAIPDKSGVFKVTRKYENSIHWKQYESETIIVRIAIGSLHRQGEKI